MHPRQTISFLLLFVEFRNQTEQNNARSSRLGGGLWGVPCHKVERMAPQQRQQQGKGLRTANTGTSADCQTLRDAPQSRGATRERRLRVRWFGCSGGQTPPPPPPEPMACEGPLFAPTRVGVPAASQPPPAAERFCVSLPSPVCVMHVALWAPGTMGSRRRAPLRLGSPHLPELLLKPGGRRGSGSCFHFMTFSC